jgi:pSer/pThr/pTyr-binding forkhead associated (FHA) protein
MSLPETAPPAYEPAAVPPIVETSDASYESPSPTYESPAADYESPTPVYESPAPVYEDSPPAASFTDTAPFDPSRTVAIIRENTVPISYGTIRFVSGVLNGEQFQVDPEGAYIGRESTLSQIVVADPRISKRHLWIGVRDGVVKIVDHDSRNGTFINDPKSERITEAALNSGDTVIMGESDVARFEFQAG